MYWMFNTEKVWLLRVKHPITFRRLSFCCPTRIPSNRDLDLTTHRTTSTDLGASERERSHSASTRRDEGSLRFRSSSPAAQRRVAVPIDILAYEYRHCHMRPHVHVYTNSVYLPACMYACMYAWVKLRKSLRGGAAASQPDGKPDPQLAEKGEGGSVKGGRPTINFQRTNGAATRLQTSAATRDHRRRPFCPPPLSPRSTSCLQGRCAGGLIRDTPRGAFRRLREGRAGIYDQSLPCESRILVQSDGAPSEL